MMGDYMRVHRKRMVLLLLRLFSLLQTSPVSTFPALGDQSSRLQAGEQILADVFDDPTTDVVNNHHRGQLELKL